MDIQREKETSHQISEESILLARKAKTEQMQNGMVSVICPRCQTHPKVIIDGNRIYVKCDCMYVRDGEIFF